MQSNAHPPGPPALATVSSRYAQTLTWLQLLHSLSGAFWMMGSAPNFTR